MLIRMIYVSTAVGPQTTSMTNLILQGSQAWNQANGVTGVLCQGQNVFLQCLEGDRRVVTQLYSRIYADRRHEDVQMIRCESILKRRYENWSMALVSLSEVDPVRKINWLEFDPYSIAGVEVMSRIDEILVTGQRISDPAL